MANRYWVGGSGTWNTTSTTNWSASSGGASGASVPTAADSVFFDQAGTYTVTMTGALACLDFNVSAGAVTFATGTTPTLAVSGNFSISGATVTWTTTAAVTFNATTAKTITTGGTTIASALTFNGAGGSWQLQDAVTTVSAAVTLTQGTLDLNGKSLTCTALVGSGTLTRALTFGTTGSINLTANFATTPLSMTDLTNFSITDPATGSVQVNLTGNSTSGTRAVAYGATAGSEAKAVSIAVLAGADTIQLNSAAQIKSLDFSGGTFTGSFAIGGAVALYGNLALRSAMSSAPTSNSTITFPSTSATTRTITSAGKSFDCPIAFNGVGGTWRLVDALTTGPTRTGTFTNGTLDLNNNVLTVGAFQSAGTSTRNMLFGTTGRVDITGRNTTIFSVTNGTLFAYDVQGGRFNAIGAGVAGETRTVFGPSTGPSATTTPNITVTAGADTLSLSNASSLLDLVFASGFTGTFAGAQMNIYGSLTLHGGMSVGTISSSIIFKAVDARTITSAGKSFDCAIFFDGTGGSWVLQDGLTLGSARTATLTNGTLNLNGTTLSTGTFSTGAGTKNVTFNGGTITCSAATTTAFNNANPTNFTTTQGTAPGTISMTGATAKTFVGGSRTYAATLNQGGAGALTITGANTLNDITATTFGTTITLPASTTTTVANFTLSGTAGNLVTLQSSTAGTRATLSKTSGTVSVSYVSIKDSAATGGAAWYAPTTQGNVDAGNNTGWVFNITLLFPARLTSTNAFYSPVVSSRITVSPTRYANTNVFYSPALSSRIALSPARYSNSNTFYSPTITSRIALSPAQYSNANTFYTASLVLGVYVLGATLVPSANTFYAAVVVPGPVSIYPTKIPSGSVVYAPFLHVYTNLKPPLLASTALFYPATLSGGSPVPIPWHPQCQRGGMAVVEAPRYSMTITELPRQNMTPGC